MKVVVQRAKNATCTVNNIIKSRIEHGLMVLVGVTHDDTIDDVKYLSKKIAKLRIFEDNVGKMNLSINEVEGEILSVSQFTLYGSCKDGNRPSFTDAAKPDHAKKLYDEFNKELRTYNINVETGIFGEDMKIHFTNDGPVTIIIDSKEKS